MSTSVNNESYFLKLTNFGFTIPSNAIIVSITAYCSGYKTGTEDQYNLQCLAFMEDETEKTNFVNYVNMGLINDTNLYSNSLYLYNSPKSNQGTLPQTNWSPNDINSSNFGICFYELVCLNPTNVYEYINNFSLTVGYVLPISHTATTNLTHTTTINPTHTTTIIT